MAAVSLVLLLLCARQILGENGYFKLRARQREIRQLELEVHRLNEENLRLERDIKRLRDDPGASERVAREEMKLVRPGEVIYILPAPPPAPSPPAAARKK